VIVGHLGVAAALARWCPRASLLWIIPAAVAPDLLDFAYALAGICNPYGLYSHTVPAALLLGVVLAGAAVLAGHRATAPVVLMAVLLHLPFDWPTGRKLYWPGGELHGLGLYQHPAVDFLMESLLVLAGWALLRRREGVPRWAAGVLTIVALVALQGGADLAGRLKPTGCAPPDTVAAAVPRPGL
jgi:hypothetical protein